MPVVQNQSLEVYYEIHGDGEPVLLLTGLGGVGRSWGDQIDWFARDFLTIVPDHRGTGQSARPRPADVPYTIEGLAADMAAVVRRIDCGPAHVVGSSTGGALAQVMALDHTDVVRSITLASSWARADDHFRHQFASRKSILIEAGPSAYTDVTALFLFSPAHIRDNYPEVQRWCQAAATGTDPEVMAARIDMIVAHDSSDRLGQISVPTLVVVGEDDVCTPPALSQELADGIAGAEFVTMPGGHLIYLEHPRLFFEIVSDFIRGV